MPRPPLKSALLAALVALAACALVACVPSSKYDALAKTAAANDEKIHSLQRDLEAARAATQARDAKLAELDTTRHNAQRSLDEATAMNEQLRAELSHLGRDVNAILKERGGLAKTLEDARLRLEELRRAQDAAEARASLFRDIASRFRPQVEAGQIRVESRRGRLSLLVRESLLFAPQRGEIAASGDKFVEELARAMIAAAPPTSGRRFLVNAHFDDPPKSKRAGASYELGAQRSIAVVERLVRLGMKPEQLIVATSGAFDPIAAGAEAGAMLGRNVLELSLQPSAEDAVNVPESSR